MRQKKIRQERIAGSVQSLRDDDDALASGPKVEHTGEVDYEERDMGAASSARQNRFRFEAVSLPAQRRCLWFRYRIPLKLSL